MDQVKYTVAELAKRNMRMWIQDESDYPSGFAGGYITERYPQLGMQDIVADITVHVAPGQTLQMPVPSDTLAIWATEMDAQGDRESDPHPRARGLAVEVSDAGRGPTPNEPRHTWQVQFMRHVYLSSPTRNFNRADGTRAKDATYTIIDYLDPKATDAFLHTVHETYYGAVGDQFGKIVLGTFGDEPDYSSGIPGRRSCWRPSRRRRVTTWRPTFLRGSIASRFPVRTSLGPTTTTCGAASSRTPSSANRPLGQGAQRRVPRPPEPRGDHARARTQRG